MEDQQTPSHSFFALILLAFSVSCGSFAAIAPKIELIVRLGAGVISAVSAVLAGRYYWYAAQEKIQSIKAKK